MVDSEKNTGFDGQSEQMIHNNDQNIMNQNGNESSDYSYNSQSPNETRNNEAEYIQGTQQDQESAAASENQYRYSRSDIPFNEESTQNSEQNNNQNGSYYGSVNYNNNTGYNGGGAYQSNGYNYSNGYTNGEANNNGNPYNTTYNNYNNGYNNETYGNPYTSSTNQTENFQAGMNQDTASDSKKKDKKKKGASFMKNKAVRLVASALGFGLIAGGVMFGLYYAGVTVFPNKTSNTYEIQTVSPTASSSSYVEDEDTASVGMNVEAVAQAALPAMVQLTGTTTVSTSSSSYGYGIWGGTQTQEATTSGTGIIVGKNDTELLILTNAHVIDGVNNLTCSFVDNSSVECSVKGSKSDKDIAVVAVDLENIPTDTLSQIAIAELGESDDVVLGQQVVAIGNALGEGQSVTSGIISALDRSITVDNVTFSGLFLTDAAINSGNSGGALLNAAGKVVGINFAKTSETGVEGMAYSIPVSNVRDLIDSLMTREKRTLVSTDQASYLGISAVDITSSMAEAYSYPQGVMISQVQSGSAAENAGLGQYDILVSFDDQSITSMSGLQSIMQYYAAGETVTIDYYHIEGNEYVLKSVDVTLGSKN